MMKAKKSSPKKAHSKQAAGQTGRKSGFLVRIRQSSLALRYVSSLFLVPLILLVLLVIFFVIDKQIQHLLVRDSISPEISRFTPGGYPVLQHAVPVVISAKSAYIMDLPSHAVLYQKNPTLRFSMASTTKLMTALTALSYYRLSSIVTVRSPHVEGSVIGLVPGQQFTVESMLYAMFLPSANDAADTLADNYPGGRQAFVAKMNENARKYHLMNTHYMDPAGLEDDEDYTTVVDLARLAAIAIQNPIIARIVETKNHTITDVTGTHVYPLQNLNKLLGYDGVNGVKTGTTEGAGQVLITSQKAGDHTYIVVVMKSQDRFADTLQLLSALSDSITYIKPELTFLR